MSDSSLQRHNLLAQLEKVAPFLEADYRAETADLQLYRSMARCITGPVLELGCGTGRVLAALLAAGQPCDGLDLSAAMLDRARQRCQVIPGDVPWNLMEGDMTAFTLPRRDYGLALLASNTLMHAACSAEQQRTLCCVYRHLRPGGTLVLDLFNPPVEELVWQRGVVQATDRWTGSVAGSAVTKWVRREVDWVHQLQWTHITYETLFADSRLEQVEACFALRFLWPHEAALMLEKAGFAVQAVWGSYRKEPLTDDSDVMVFVARK